MVKAPTQLFCDYLVLGGGASSIAFIDTILNQIPSAKIVLVDKKASPGGHWNDAYGFVKLHQPSIAYGIESKALEGNWLKLLLRGILPWKHRATKDDILNYFRTFIHKKVKSGQVEYYPNSIYDFQQDIVGNVHHFSSLDGKLKYSVKVNEKIVNGVLGECQVPSQVPVKFPVDDSVNLLTPNQLFGAFEARNTLVTNKDKKYVVLGCGKTGMDTVVYLQSVMKVDPGNISWVIPNDVWMTSRGNGGPWSWGEALLDQDGDEEKARLSLEKKGVFVRLDKNILPTKFRFPVIGDDELVLMRRVKNMIRRGRVASIGLRSDDRIEVGFDRDDSETWISPSPAEDYVFVHCTSPGPFNDATKDIDRLFVSEKEMILHLLFAPPISQSMSCLAFLEASRKKGTLDLEFGRQLVQASLKNVESSCRPDSWTGNEVLNELVRGFKLIPGKVSTQFTPVLNLAMIVALADPDPMVGFKWMQSNRLSTLSIPGFKSKIYEDLSELATKKHFGFSEGELEMIKLLRDKLQVLKGK